MTYESVNQKQAERINNIAKEENKTIKEIMLEINDYYKYYDSLDMLLDDYEDSVMIKKFEKENDVKVISYIK